MTLNLNTDFDKKDDEGRLSPVEVKKTSVLHVPETRKGILRRKLSGDRNQCPTCLEYFNSSKAFDLHRTGLFNDGRRCLTVAEMHKKNFGINKDGFWLCPVLPKDQERLNYLRTRKKKLNTSHNYTSGNRDEL